MIRKEQCELTTAGDGICTHKQDMPQKAYILNTVIELMGYKMRITPTRIHGERKLCKVKRRKKQRKGGKEQSKCKSVVVTAVQASPGGASEMGWKTNQGHRSDFATVLVPISSSCGLVYYTSLISHVNKN